MVNYFKLLRLSHWLKNIFLFAAPFFGGSLFSHKILITALPAFLAFSFAASAVYIFNDTQDIERDRHHPKKKDRPIASGSVSIRTSYIYSAFLVLVSLTLSFIISKSFLLFVIIYILIHIAYSVFLKDIAIVDIFCIASGFVIRVLAGGAAFNVHVTAWLLITMFMISLVLGAGKRLAEVSLLNDRANEHRKSLNHYSAPALNEILLISASASLIAYTMYTIEQFKSLIYTVPIVSFGLFRYILISRKGLGDPTEALTKDRWLSLTVILWLLVIGLLRYR